jgi:hypothetical protein
MTKLWKGLLAGGVVIALIAGFVLLAPFGDWLPGGSVANLPRQEVVNGTAFNALFPPAPTGTNLVYTQEKRGFSEARLKQGDQALALLAITDTNNAPEARSKFADSSEQLAGWPLVEQGDHASTLLVADRFQVKVIEQNEGLDLEARHQLLDQFDLPGLAKLQPAA